MVSQPVTFAVPGAFASTRQSSGSPASFVTEMMLPIRRTQLNAAVQLRVRYSAEDAAAHIQLRPV